MIDRGNRPRIKYIWRLSEKQILHLEGLGHKIHAEETRKGVPMEEEDPREVPHMP
jgi:hypothetical protein